MVYKHLQNESSSPADYDESDYSDLTRPKKPKKIVVNEEEEYFNRPKEIRTETVYNACDKKSELYVMQQDKFIKGDGFIYESLPSNPAEYGFHPSSVKDLRNDQNIRSRLLHRPYFAKRIPRSNLLMIIVENEYPSDHVVLSAAPQDINYNVSEGLPCVKTRLNFLPRRRLEECYTEHPDVSTECRA